ncbi:MAG: ATP-dependent helicase [Candidatus Omnitrophica bacterium]|nr:ATP-dependent helicase [Candidatus Omnitrophota bacterium]
MNPDGKSPELNASQQQAADYTGGHLLIVAGPGTGKTHTLTYRIARISRQLQAGERTLAITFTHKAAEELRERLVRSFPAAQEKVFVGTFHGFCLSYLREHIQDTGLPREWNIAVAHDLERIAGELWPDIPKRQIKKRLHAVIESKTRGSGGEISGEVAAYNAILKANGLLDYDDLLLEARKLLSSRRPRGSLREEPTGHAQKSEFTHVFVDEYQDINALQHALLKEFVRRGATLTAIGDPHQAIYSFRGADVSFFERFAEDFKGAAILSLSDNYRSAPNLLKASGQIVARETPLVCAVTADIYREGRLTVYDAPTDKAEAEYVVHQIEKMVGGTSMFSQDSGRVASTPLAQRSFTDIAVLYRLNAQKIVLEEALGRHGIPYQTSDDRPFAELAPVPELVALLKDLRGSGVLSDVMTKLPQTAGGEKIFKDSRPAWQKNVARFVRMAQRFDHVEEFLDYLALQQPEDAIERRAENVHLLTLHAAKGLEFPVVFIVGCEQGLLPLSIENMVSDPQEERRLFYVGMTRAKEVLFLTHARRRRLWGRRLSGCPSFYLDDIEHQLKEYERAGPARRPRDRDQSRQIELFPAP